MTREGTENNNRHSPTQQPYSYKMSWSQARAKLKTFNKLYYQKKKANLKLAFLPQWMDSYGRLLELENSGNLPRFLPILKPGTIVMVNFGVGIGSEMSLNHFAIVLSKHDTKYKHTVIVVPLSSKKHPKEGYLPLGNIITEQLTSMFQKRSEEMLKSAKEIKDNIKELENNAHFHMEIAEETYNNFLAHGVNLKDLSENMLEITNVKQSKFYQIYQDTKRINSQLHDKEIAKMLDLISTIYEKSDQTFSSVDKMQRMADELESLFKKAKKYNKQTFADVGNITTVSKMRIIKFSKFNISENTKVPQEILDKILDRLHDFI